MQFIYHPDAGSAKLVIEGETYQHLYKSRRTKQEKTLFLRNLKDENLYCYMQESIARREAILVLHSIQHSPNLPKSPSHLVLACIENKTLQKVLPFLNELGVGKLSLFFADYSQKQEKYDLQKLQRILIHSSEQCGRSDCLELEWLSNLQEVLQLYPKLGVLDFGGERLQGKDKLPILIGPEGGFSPKEREILASYPKYSTQENLILRSESACVFVASLLLG